MDRVPDDPQPVDSVDEPLKIDLDPETALRGLLKVDPEAEPADEDSELRHDAE